MNSKMSTSVSPGCRARFKQSCGEWSCHICGASEAEAGGPLHVHHQTYERFGHELNADLAPLCQSCHALFHARHARGNIGSYYLSDLTPTARKQIALQSTRSRSSAASKLCTGLNGSLEAQANKILAKDNKARRRAKKPKQSPYGLSPQEASELKRINKEKHKARRSRLKQRRDNPSSDH